jgi:hypothetical protein
VPSIVIWWARIAAESSVSVGWPTDSSQVAHR